VFQKLTDICITTTYFPKGCHDLTCTGADRHKETDSELAPPKGSSSIKSYGSNNSLNSGSSGQGSMIGSGGNKEAPDTPEQFEVLKHQKEVWETGITL
jgi:brefeldin A-inhibited guanine nucleotide-exchange protein